MLNDFSTSLLENYYLIIGLLSCILSAAALLVLLSPPPPIAAAIKFVINHQPFDFISWTRSLALTLFMNHYKIFPLQQIHLDLFSFKYLFDFLIDYLFFFHFFYCFCLGFMFLFNEKESPRSEVSYFTAEPLFLLFSNKNLHYRLLFH